MPIYEYSCMACGHKFELVQKMSDIASSVCPKCGTDNVEKMISAGAFHLKGSGWYADGYSKDTKRNQVCDAPKSSDCGGCDAASN